MGRSGKKSEQNQRKHPFGSKPGGTVKRKGRSGPISDWRVNGQKGSKALGPPKQVQRRIERGNESEPLVKWPGQSSLKG